MPCNLRFAIKRNNQFLNPVEAFELLECCLDPFYDEEADIIIEQHNGFVEIMNGNQNLKIDPFNKFHTFKGQFEKSSLYKDPLAKAIGCKGSYRPEVLDSTFGWGDDSLRMLAWGCHVHGLERNPVIFSAMKLALKKLSDLPVSLEWIDSKDYEQIHDVVYFDPMFEEKDLKSLPKKEMQWLRLLAGKGDLSASDNFNFLKTLASKRLVVKRSLKAESFGRFEMQIKGKRSRFDVNLF